MLSNKIKWNCTFILPCLICTLHVNIQYDGMFLNCEAGINEVTWFIQVFCVAFIDITDFKNYTLNNILSESGWKCPLFFFFCNSLSPDAHENF